MTKRFELVWKDTGEVLHDNETGLDKGIYSPDYRFHVRDMMNELAEENEQLQLDNKRLLSDYTDVCNENVALEKENEQLKSQLRNLRKLANEIYMEKTE